MKKRFLAAIAVCVLACSPAAKTSSGSNANTDVVKDWNIGLQLWTFRVFTFKEAIDKADSLGIKNIQAFPGQKLGGSWTGGFDPSMSAADRTSVKQYLQSKGMKINEFGVGGADDLAGWVKLFDFAKDMNIPILVSEPKDDQWNYVDSLAGKYGIRIAIHDHPRPSHYWSPDSVLLAMQGHPNIGACADVGHWARSGLNVVDCLQKLKGRIWNVHLKDVATFDKTEAADTIPGKGVIDFPAVFKELKSQNYKGDFSIEHESNWYNNAGDVAEIVQYYNQQVNALK